MNLLVSLRAPHRLEDITDGKIRSAALAAEFIGNDVTPATVRTWVQATEVLEAHSNSFFLIRKVLNRLDMLPAKKSGDDFEYDSDKIFERDLVTSAASDADRLNLMKKG